MNLSRTALIAAVTAALGLGTSCAYGTETRTWLCEPTWALWPGKAHHEDWPLLPGRKPSAQTTTHDGIQLEIYPADNPEAITWSGYHTRPIAGFNRRTGRFFQGYLTHGPLEAIQESRRQSEQFRKNPRMAPELVEKLNALHASTGIGAQEASQLLRERPGAEIPAGHALHAWWKSHQTCKQAHALKFWPQAFLRAIGAGCAAM